MKNGFVQSVDLESIKIDEEAVKKIPEDIARGNCLIGFEESNVNINIAISFEPNAALKDELRFITNREINFFYEDTNKIINAINNCYCKYGMKNAIKTIKTEELNLKNSTYQKINNEAIKEAPIVKIINSIINSALYQKASDIHLEPFKNNVLVRFRVDGIISYFDNIPKEIYKGVCTSLKAMASMNISEKRIPQDGKLKYTYENRDYDCRISILPTVFGEKIVIRILHEFEKIKKLNDLGFNKTEVKNIEAMSKNTNGIILVTGPTGSGKSTTLYSIINNLNKEEKNITSIEDPVECIVDNVNQVKVNNKIGFDFAQGLKSILRQDPDIVMIGEIRDEETAHIAIRAAITGHLVLSTLHTNNALDSAVRLLDMGIPSYLIEDALVGIVAQRLVRKICPYCKQSYYPLDYEREDLKMNPNQKLYKGKGCYKCRGTGYKGRTVICEIVDIKALKKNNVINQKYIKSLDSYRLNNHFISIRDNCIELIKNGITTYEEFIRISI